MTDLPTDRLDAPDTTWHTPRLHRLTGVDHAAGKFYATSEVTTIPTGAQLGPS